MKKRLFPADSNNTRIMGTKNLWNGIYSSLDFKSYIATLEYDDTTNLIAKYTNELDRDIKILDAGCGSGRHISYLQKLGFTNITGADLSIAGLRLARNNLKNTNFAASDITSLPFKKDSFDLVIIVGVIYEIEQTDLHTKLLIELAKILNSEGRIIFVNNSPYNFGERLYTITQKLNFIKNKNNKFYIWKIGYKDVKKWCGIINFEIKQHKKCNYGRALYRFLYGVFVKKENRKERKFNLLRRNTYDLHEHYLANRKAEYFNSLGKIFLRFSVLLNKIFYAAEIYVLTRNTNSHEK